MSVLQQTYRPYDGERLVTYGENDSVGKLMLRQALRSAGWRGMARVEASLSHTNEGSHCKEASHGPEDNHSSPASQLPQVNHAHLASQTRADSQTP